jgi:hypothetical protein
MKARKKTREYIGTLKTKTNVIFAGEYSPAFGARTAFDNSARPGWDSMSYRPDTQLVAKVLGPDNAPLGLAFPVDMDMNHVLTMTIVTLPSGRKYLEILLREGNYSHYPPPPPYKKKRKKHRLKAPL